MPKYENPAKKKVNFLQDSLCYWYRLFSASHRKTAESLLPKHGCENYKSVSRLFKERYGCSMKEMQKRYEKEKGDRPMGQWVRIRKAEMP